MKNRVLILAVCSFLAACETEAERQAKAALAAEQAVQAAQKAERALFEKRKAEFLGDPSRFLGTSELKFFDKGFFNSYRKLIGVTVENQSALSIRLTKGRVIWLSESGDEMGSSPLTFKGAIIPAGEQVFSEDAGTLTSGTIEGDAKRARIEFTGVEVLEPAQR